VENDRSIIARNALSIEQRRLRILNMQEPVFIEQMADARLQASLALQSRVGVDTEFMRERTFFSQLCLVQISSGDDIFCVDPLHESQNEAPQSADTFWQSLMQIPWVLHSGRQDIEVVSQSANKFPASVFDTQVAAALLGYAPQMGYAGLVAELFDVQLAKSHTRADWTRRPLPDAVLEYAAEDVLYLIPAYEILKERLSALGRLSWAEDDSADLLQPSLYDLDPDLAIGKLKGARNLTGEVRSAAVRLAAWREREALRSNRPRQWIIKDKVLLDIAVAQPGSTEELIAIPDLAERTATRASQAILTALDKAKSDNSDYKPPARPDDSQKALLKVLQQRVADCATELGIASEIIAPKKELAAATGGNRGGRVFRGWRADLIGNSLLELLND
jgi:ribonuclease D